MDTPKIVNLRGGYHPALSLWLERPVVALRAYAEFEDAEADRLAVLDANGKSQAQVYLNVSGSPSGDTGLFVLVAPVGRAAWTVRRILKRAERRAVAAATEAASQVSGADAPRQPEQRTAAPDREPTVPSRRRGGNRRGAPVGVAPNRPSPRLSGSKAQALHVAMGAAGFPSNEHKARATAALGREEAVVSFFELSEDDDTTIRTKLGLALSTAPRRARSRATT